MVRQPGTRPAWLAFAAGFGAAGLLAGSSPTGYGGAELLRPFVPAVSMEQDRRASLEDFARRNGLDVTDLRNRFGATGLVRCGNAIGTAQLTLRNDVITTAAHVLIGPNGRPRGGCVFKPVAGGRPVPIEPSSIKAGSRTPLNERATRDWAVARLAAPVAGAKPYGIGFAGAKRVSVHMCAGGHNHTAIATERCSTRGIIGTSPDGIRELAIDCNAGPGSSGAALIAGHRIVAIYVGYRSTNPGKAQAFSKTHYNFAISIDGPFRRALRAATSR